MPRQRTAAELNVEILSVGKTIVSLKGWLTRAINSAVAAAGMADNARPSETLLDTLRDMRAKVQDALDKDLQAVKYIQELDSQVDGTNFDHYEATLSTEIKRASDCEVELLRVIAKYEDALRPRMPAPQAAHAPDNRYKPNEALRPEKLLRQHTPVELKLWIQKFEAFFVASRLRLAPIQEQQAYFRACVEEALMARFNDRIGANTAVLPNPQMPGDESCIQFLKEEFRDQHPLVSRRYNFFKETQKPGQAFSDWAISLKRYGDEAELVRVTEDDIYVMRYLTGGYDERLRRRLLRVEEPTRILLDREVQRYEAEVNSLKTYAPPAAAAASAAAAETGLQKNVGGGGAAKKKGGRTDFFNERFKAFEKENRCPKCGDKKGPGGQHNCSVGNKECEGCGKRGHLLKVCFKSQQAGQKQTATAKATDGRPGFEMGDSDSGEDYAGPSANSVGAGTQRQF